MPLSAHQKQDVKKAIQIGILQLHRVRGLKWLSREEEQALYIYMVEVLETGRDSNGTPYLCLISARRTINPGQESVCIWSLILGKPCPNDDKKWPWQANGPFAGSLPYGLLFELLPLVLDEQETPVLRNVATVRCQACHKQNLPYGSIRCGCGARIDGSQGGRTAVFAKQRIVMPGNYSPMPFWVCEKCPGTGPDRNRRRDVYYPPVECYSTIYQKEERDLKTGGPCVVFFADAAKAGQIHDIVETPNAAVMAAAANRRLVWMPESQGAFQFQTPVCGTTGKFATYDEACARLADAGAEANILFVPFHDQKRQAFTHHHEATGCQTCPICGIAHAHSARVSILLVERARTVNEEPIGNSANTLDLDIRRGFEQILSFHVDKARSAFLEGVSRESLYCVIQAVIGNDESLRVQLQLSEKEFLCFWADVMLLLVEHDDAPRSHRLIHQAMDKLNGPFGRKLSKPAQSCGNLGTLSRQLLRHDQDLRSMLELTQPEFDRLTFNFAVGLEAIFKNS